MTVGFSLETVEARSKWTSICKVLKESSYQTQILYP